MKRIAVLEQFAHHNPATSPDNMVNYLRYDDIVRFRQTEYGHGVAGKVMRRMDRMTKRTTGMTGYSLAALFSELDLYHRSFLQRNLIHFFNGDINGKILPYVKGRNVVITTFHQPADYFYNFFKKCSHIRRLDAVIMTSTTQKEVFDRYLPEEKIYFLPLAVDVDLFKPSESPKLDSPKKICLFVGNWLRDFETLCDAARLLEKKDSVEFHVVTLEANRKFFKNSRNVRFYSGIPLDQYVRELHMADLLVIPFKSCTSNLAILEGMASGLPIVTTDVGGIRDYVEESFAVLLEKGNSRKLADSVLDLLSDEKRRLSMSRRAREHAIEFSWENISSRLEKIYREVSIS